jgi:alkaline phosphatase
MSHFGLFRLCVMSSLMSLLFLTGCSSAQSTTTQRTQTKIQYSVQNAHSHNDYEQPRFFFDAYKAGFGSMEADIYLVDGDLLVAHGKNEIDPHRSLAAMYLSPLANNLKMNKGYPYKNHQANLELLIDLKDPKDSPAYQKAVTLILSYKALKGSKNLRITFTGNIPSDSVMAAATGMFYFDGVPGRSYSPDAQKRIYMLSDNFADYSAWKGEGEISKEDYQKLKSTVEAAHAAGKKIRFWNAPDNKTAWETMEKLGVDYINTDKIDALAVFLHKTY